MSEYKLMRRQQKQNEAVVPTWATRHVVEYAVCMMKFVPPRNLLRLRKRCAY